MKTKEDIIKSCNSIRECLDADIVDCDMVSVEKLKEIISIGWTKCRGERKCKEISTQKRVVYSKGK